jgi:murein DD-endopeptidase MepM/ murein hydrolase activator NlpD
MSLRSAEPGNAAVLVAGILLAFVGMGIALKNRQEPAAQIQVPAPMAVPAAASLPAPAPAEPGRLAFPLPGFEHALRDNFYEKRGVRTHSALDIMAPRGTPVLAVDDGTVAKLYRGPMAGVTVYQFDTAKARVYMYAHLDRYAPGLALGQPVRRGQVIGFVGSTGNAPESAPHLHFAMHELPADKRWWRGKAVNPYALLARPERSGAVR